MSDPSNPTTDGENSSKFRPRVLNGDLAYKIYREKELGAYDDASISRKSTEVAIKYGTSAKTVRDIWSRRTWTGATEALWTVEEVLEYGKQAKRGPGRPMGAKDSRPRKKKPLLEQQPSEQDDDQNAEASSTRPRQEPGISLPGLTCEGVTSKEVEEGSQAKLVPTDLTLQGIEHLFQEDLS
eukprot:750499-Hanusia_phi.AAC.3